MKDVLNVLKKVGKSVDKAKLVKLLSNGGTILGVASTIGGLIWSVEDTKLTEDEIKELRQLLAESQSPKE